MGKAPYWRTWSVFLCPKYNKKIGSHLENLFMSYLVSEFRDKLANFTLVYHDSSKTLDLRLALYENNKKRFSFELYR